MADDILFSQFPKSELFAAIEIAVDKAISARLNQALISPVDKPPITQKELCKYLDVTQQTIIRWKKKKVIPFYTVGNAIRFDLDKVLKALGK